MIECSPSGTPVSVPSDIASQADANTKMSRPTLSIAMCTYNGAPYVQEQLDSIAGQTRPPDELVVCDDHSTDETREIVNAFARRAQFPVHVFANERTLGCTKNFERGIGLCTSDIIALADQDDVWHPDKLQCLEAAICASPGIGAAFSNAELVDEQLRPLQFSIWQALPFRPEDQRRIRRSLSAFEVLLRRNVVTGATMAIRAKYKSLILPMPESWMHDGWAALLISSVADVALIDQCLISYRQHMSNLIGAIKVRKRRPPRPFSEVYKDRISQFTAARERLLAMRHEFDIPEGVLLKVESKITHLRVRGALPRSRWRRLPIAVRELLALRYHRYHDGAVSFTKDLLRTVPKFEPKP